MKAILFFLSILTFTSCKEESTALRLVTELGGTSLPEFTILTADGKYFSSSTFKREQPVVIFYFDPGCIQCRVQTRNMKDVINKLKDVQIWLVTSAEHKRVYQYAKHFKLDKYPNVMVGVDTGHILLKYLQASSVPYTAVYDKNRRFINAYTGRMGGKQWITVTHQFDNKTSRK